MSKPLHAAVIGHPISHSLSPRIHQSWLDDAGLYGFYTSFDVAPEDLADSLQALMKLGFAGVNITIPHKEKALQLADEISARAVAVGAANTLTFQDGKIFADNTDVHGFAHYLTIFSGRSSYDHAVVLGAGGASRAIMHALAQMNVGKITIVNRTITRAEEVAALAPRSKVASWEEAWGDDVDLMVNTTSLGLGQDADGNKALEKAAGQLIEGGVAMDIVYKPIKTHFLEQAEYRGAITIDGLGMLVHQAAPAFEAFYGQPPSNPDKILQQLLGEFSS